MQREEVKNQSPGVSGVVITALVSFMIGVVVCAVLQNRNTADITDSVQNLAVVTDSVTERVKVVETKISNMVRLIVRPEVVRDLMSRVERLENGVKIDNPTPLPPQEAKQK